VAIAPPKSRLEWQTNARSRLKWIERHDASPCFVSFDDKRCGTAHTRLRFHKKQANEASLRWFSTLVVAFDGFTKAFISNKRVRTEGRMDINGVNRQDASAEE
jgi:hypothetical protein